MGILGFITNKKNALKRDCGLTSGQSRLIKVNGIGHMT